MFCFPFLFNYAVIPQIYLATSCGGPDPKARNCHIHCIMNIVLVTTLQQ